MLGTFCINAGGKKIENAGDEFLYKLLNFLFFFVGGIFLSK